jgi:hypothetical protein
MARVGWGRTRHVVGQALVWLLATAGCRTSSASLSSSVTCPSALAPVRIRDAIVVRGKAGLKVDPKWVVAVTRDPSSVLYPLGVAVTAAERQQLERAKPEHSRPKEQQREDMLNALDAYASEHRDQFGGIYLDNGAQTVIMLFTADLGVHASATKALIRADFEVDVRACRFTVDELEQAMEHFHARTDALRGDEVWATGYRVDTKNNVLVVDAQSNRADAATRVEAGFDGKVKANIRPLPDAHWKHATAGQGWRLVATGRTSSDEAYKVRAATDAASWSALWKAVRLSGPPPPLNLGREIAVSFAYGSNGSCPHERLDGVVIDRVLRLIYSKTSTPEQLGSGMCLLNLSAAVVFVIAVVRDQLPESPITLQLSEHQSGCSEDGQIREAISIEVEHVSGVR